MSAARIGTLSTQLGSNTPPTSFRLFKPGWNDTENGRFLFDRQAATQVMAAYRKWGVDLAIDLEHQMLTEDIAPDPTAKDARGWFQLELRPDGSLWATSVMWTADGAQRLADRRQRYVSPAFSYDTDTKRITAIVNCAIVAMPATHNTPALMAASARWGESAAERRAMASLSASAQRACAASGCTALDFLEARRFLREGPRFTRNPTRRSS